MGRLATIASLAGLMAISVAGASAQSFLVNGKVVKLETVVKAGKVYADAVALARALGASVTYDKAKKQYTITTGAGQQVVQGTTQMAGEWAEFGKEYTLDKDDPMNFALRGAEFVASRVRIGDDVFFPTANEKLLVLHYTIHNPQNRDKSAGWDTFELTAVDATNANREFSQEVGQEANSLTLRMDLKPAQKVEAYTFIVVPAAGEIPKLIVKRGEGPVLRYDLRGKVKALSAPFADPSDPSGCSALAQVPAQMNTYYPTGVYDIQLTNAVYTEEAVRGEKPESGNRYLVLTLAVKNQAVKAEDLHWDSFQFKLRTQDGDNIEWNECLLHGSQDQSLSVELDPGQEVRARVYFELPSGSSAKTLFIKEDEEGRSYAFDLSELK